MLERDVEKKVCDYAKAKGWLTYKWTSPGHAFIPDRVFIAPGGQVVFIEFKRPGGKATPGQLREIERLKAQGCVAVIVFNVDEGKGVVDAYSI